MATAQNRNGEQFETIKNGAQRTPLMVKNLDEILPEEALQAVSDLNLIELTFAQDPALLATITTHLF